MKHDQFKHLASHSQNDFELLKVFKKNKCRYYCTRVLASPYSAIRKEHTQVVIIFESTLPVEYQRFVLSTVKPSDTA